MTIETATYISSLNTAYPEGGSFASQLDDHVRLIKATLRSTFPNITGPVTATQGILNQAIPSGIITMWSGSVASIPSGWLVCDGTLSTPDLRDRFVLGQGPLHAQGTVGGSVTTSAGGAHTPVTATGGAHDHGLSTAPTTLTLAMLPAHAHTMTIETYTETGVGKVASGGPTVDDGPVAGLNTDSVGGGAGHSHAIAADTGHTHVMTAVVDHTHTVTPPYFALAYIMKS